jgi:hypothetical protein
MKMLRIYCPVCQSYVPADLPLTLWPCPKCQHLLTPTADTQIDDAAPLPACQFCGEPEMYVQKDFPHWLGIGILLVAVVASLVAYAQHKIFWTWAILLGSAAADGLLYWLVGNVTVCYRCLAQHRKFPPNPAHKPFDLSIGEKYRQERLRRHSLPPAPENRIAS